MRPTYAPDVHAQLCWRPYLLADELAEGRLVEKALLRVGAEDRLGLLRVLELELLELLGRLEAHGDVHTSKERLGPIKF